MAVNIELERGGNESNTSFLRKFTKKVQGSGVLPRVRSIRYSSRKLSHYKTKIKTLEGLKRKSEREELIKMGKIQERVEGQSRTKR